jgi:tripartite ATP-independent transporter DctP family solute receptor
LTGVGALAGEFAAPADVQADWRDSSAGEGATQKVPGSAPRRPRRFRLAGYGPATTSCSQGIKRIGDRLKAKFGDSVDVKYIYNILDLGYNGGDFQWLVEDDLLTLVYHSTSAYTELVPELGIAELPFLFSSAEKARAAMDGELGNVLTAGMEARLDYRVLGYFENGFRHLSNSVRPVRTPADLKGLTVRVMASKFQARTFELLGAIPKVVELPEAIEGVRNGTLQAQENPFENTVTYGMYKYHRYHTKTGHCYLSRPVFVHRQAFDAWPQELQAETRAAVREAVTFQRDLHMKEEAAAAATIRKEGGEIIELTPEQHQAFVAAVNPVYAEARGQYSRELLALIDRYHG